MAQQVRELLDDWRQQGLYEPTIDGWLTGFSEKMSVRLGEAGLLGMALPRRYGGQSGSAIDRYVVTEELLLAGAPVAAHWFAERQVAPALLRHGTEAQRARFIPKIVAGQCYFSIGLSEPEAGSDLASVQTRARRFGDGWRITGTKVWTSQAHRSQYLLLLARSGEPPAEGRRGLTQFIVPLNADGVTVSPIQSMDGGKHFTEVHLDEVYVSDDDVVGVVGDAWNQVMEELTYERTGAERMLSTFPLLLEAHRALDGWDRPGPAAVLGRLLVDAFALRETVTSVVAAMADPQRSSAATALAKDVATRYEQRLIEDLRDVRPVLEELGSTSELNRLSRQAMLAGPTMTLRGGANEVLRAIVARDLIRRSGNKAYVGSPK